MKKLVIAIAVFSLLTLKASAYTASSSNYKLEVADETTSSLQGSSASYQITGIAGDQFDSKSTSTSYKVCAGYVEETTGACIVTPPPPPPPSGCTTCGGGPIPGPDPYKPPEPEEPEPPVEPEEPEEPQGPGPLDITISTVPWLIPQPAEPAAPVKKYYPAAPEYQEPALLTNVWCENNACVGKPYQFLKPAAEEQTKPIEIIDITWIIILAAVIISWITVKYHRKIRALLGRKNKKTRSGKKSRK